MAVASMHLGVWSWSRQSPELQTVCQNGKERGFKQFWQAGWAYLWKITRLVCNFCPWLNPM